MKKIFGFLAFLLPLIAQASEYSSTLVVQTGHLRESDLVVRNITDLRSKKTCLAFYVRTTGTSAVMKCYDVVGEFGTQLSQVGHIKEDDLIIRKVEDAQNGVACLVAYVSTPGTSPAVDCYPSAHRFRENIVQDAHVREGDLDVRRISDPSGQRACLVTYVGTTGTSPSILCYDSQPKGTGGLHQVSHLREGDLVVRKIVDRANKKACMVTYVSTEGTSSRLFCFDE